MSDALEIIDSEADLLFHCPGELSPISRSVHYARLSSGWSGCATCPSRLDSAVMMQQVSAESHTSKHIVRTRWGVRGAWQNVITRRVAARLTAIITSQLTRLHSTEPLQDDDGQHADQLPQLSAPQPVTVVIGYDGRASSPDIYAGVVSAAIQNGTNVIDAGRSTAAAIQEACRSFSDVAAGLIVTGAGAADSLTGFDLFDRTGNPVPIAWQDWNVTVRRQFVSGLMDDAEQANTHSDIMSRLQASIRSDEMSPYPTSLPAADGSPSQSTILELPGASTLFGCEYRQSRATGSCDMIESEELYRRHLSRWFPEEVSTRVTCLCSDELVADRLEWLSTRPGLTIDIVPSMSRLAGPDQLTSRIAEVHAHWGLMISDDDRYVTIANRHGSILDGQVLAEWVNSSIRTVMPHVTAHVPDGEDRVVLLDAGRPHQPDANEVISDGLALMGCICRLIHQGNLLPHLR